MKSAWFKGAAGFLAAVLLSSVAAGCYVHDTVRPVRPVVRERVVEHPVVRERTDIIVR